MEGYHQPIMLREVIEGLAIKEGGIYLDATVGGAGHSFEILRSDPTVRLIATDKDGEAIAEAERRLSPFAGRFSLHRTDYKNFEHVLDEEGIGLVDGILADFGISSHQIDDRRRGFAYRIPDAPLDMRMDTRAALTAEEVVNTYSEHDLRRIFRDYGEESFAGPIARNIVLAREHERITTAGRLRELTEGGIPPKFRSAACARKVFQAIRIEVNGELDGLRECVTAFARRLKPEGRLCILTFHSLEDRIVKEVFRDLATACTCPKSFPVCVCGKKQEIEIITKKPFTASQEEVEENPRSKSAKLRIARKLPREE